MRILLFLTLAFALAGCGKFGEKFGRLKGEDTSVSFAVSGGQGLTAALPGVMVYAMRVGNAASKGAIYLPSEAAPASWVIPNGNYDFFAFGYTGAGLTGTMHCGRALNIPLTGGATTVSLALDDGGVCGTPPFSPTGFGSGDGNAPLPLKIASCDASTGSFASVAPPSAGCNSGGRPIGSNIETVKISFPEFTRWNPGEDAANKGPGLASACITGPFNGMGDPTSLQIPAGPFVVQLETYSVTACTGFMGAYTFVNGIMAAHDNQSVRFIDAGNTRVFPGIQMALGIYESTIATYLYVRVY